MKRLEGNEAWGRIARLLAVPDTRGPDDPAFVRWKHDCLHAISMIDGEQSSAFWDFDRIASKASAAPISASPILRGEDFGSCRRQLLAILQSVQASTQESVLDEMRREQLHRPEVASKQASSAKIPPAIKKVFLVHGHDEKLKAQVARCLERLDLQPVILHEQPSLSQTIIEKFEKHADVVFAVVLLTPDDVGGQANARTPQQPRARQNVVFEFGYFLGRLGRSKVCCLYTGDVEMLSDWSGVLYIKADVEGAWKLSLAGELKAAGFDVDANRLLPWQSGEKP